jgi:hypothetical protein
MLSPCYSDLRSLVSLQRVQLRCFEINGHPYNECYYLDNCISPEWSTFVKTIPKPMEEKNRKFAKQQEACRMDVERAFGVLQSRWAIVRHPAMIWSIEVI